MTMVVSARRQRVFFDLSSCSAADNAAAAADDDNNDNASFRWFCKQSLLAFLFLILLLWNIPVLEFPEKRPTRCFCIRSYCWSGLNAETVDEMAAVRRHIILTILFMFSTRITTESIRKDVGYVLLFQSRSVRLHSILLFFLNDDSTVLAGIMRWW